MINEHRPTRQIRKMLVQDLNASECRRLLAHSCRENTAERRKALDKRLREINP